MRFSALIFFVCVLFATTTQAQDFKFLGVGYTGAAAIQPVEAPDEVRAGDKFHRGIVQAVRSAQRSGKISRREALRVRVAMISPAVRKHAEDLALLQIAASGEDSDAIPTDANGDIDRTAIDWDGLAAFLEAFIPILLQLLDLFGV